MEDQFIVAYHQALIIGVNGFFRIRRTMHSNIQWLEKNFFPIGRRDHDDSENELDTDKYSSISILFSTEVFYIYCLEDCVWRVPLRNKPISPFYCCS